MQNPGLVHGCYDGTAEGMYLIFGRYDVAGEAKSRIIILRCVLSIDILKVGSEKTLIIRLSFMLSTLCKTSMSRRMF